ncbi:MAG: YncE family protein, partial [Verrucomicrobia bacterium]|nr:YncE family protein [Verrucomicrobiota bacterium]
MSRIIAIILLVLGGLDARAAEPARAAKADAAALGWGWLPVPPGQLVPLGDLPLNMAASPDGRWVVVTHGGPGQQSLWLYDGTTGRAFPIAVAGKDDAFFYGVAFSADGKRIFSTGGAANTLYVHDLKDWWQESRLARFSFGPPGAPFFPAGLALLPDGHTLCVANLLADHLALVDVGNPADPKLVTTIRVGARPFNVLVDKAGRFAYVTHWGEPTVGIVDLKARQLTESVKVGAQPMAVALAPDAKLLYAACAEDDHVAVVDLQTRKRIGVIELGSPVAGTQPTRPMAMTLSRDGNRLYVASALYHDLIVVDTKTRKAIGMIPTGWCPTAVALAPNA